MFQADALAAAEGVHLVALFAPEHGFRGSAQAGSSEDSTVDIRTRVPVFDIYRKSPASLSALFASSGIDTLIFDIQDVGVRFYTYIWTLYDCLVATQMTDQLKQFLVLDRPNPIGGRIVDGPLMSADLASFVGRKSIALRHGMTVAELALLFWTEFVPEDSDLPTIHSGRKGTPRQKLEIVKLKNWSRDSLSFSPGCCITTPSSSTSTSSSTSATAATCHQCLPLPWIPPSPNMPTAATAHLYPATCLLEGTNCSEGRGTCLPFSLVGAPFADHQLADTMRGNAVVYQRHALLVREAHFVPSWGDFKGQKLCGIQIEVVDPSAFNSLHFGISLLCLLKRLYPTNFKWRRDRDNTYWIDRLSGSNHLRESVDAGLTPDEIVATWQNDLLWFNAVRQNYLQY